MVGLDTFPHFLPLLDKDLCICCQQREHDRKDEEENPLKEILQDSIVIISFVSLIEFQGVLLNLVYVTQSILRD